MQNSDKLLKSEDTRLSHDMGSDVRKPVVGVSDQVRLARLSKFCLTVNNNLAPLNWFKPSSKIFY